MPLIKQAQRKAEPWLGIRVVLDIFVRAVLKA
jgi:hypothetical protein